LEDNGESPEEATARSELRKALENCLKTLPIDFKTVVILVDIQGLDYAEAAQAIGKPLGTIKSRLARARMRMRICLSSYRELLPKAFRLMSEI
jgi:RNA polymerase sigma-70 factor (ECF subfamily)